jgi:hypothetical protein
MSSVSGACADAFAVAAGVSEYQDTHEDLFPAYSACPSVGAALKLFMTGQ